MEAGLNSITDLLISLIELFEAEGRTLRRSAVKLGHAVAALAITAVFIVAGIGLLLWALYQYLVTAMQPVTATLLVGVLALIVAGLSLWLVQRLGR